MQHTDALRLSSTTQSAQLLDHVLGQELGTVYTRSELKQLFNLQALQSRRDAHREGPSEEAGIAPTEAGFMIGALSLSERVTKQIMTDIGDIFGVFADLCPVDCAV